MPITTHVTSLELSRRLKELNVPQSSHFYWRKTYSWSQSFDKGISQGKVGHIGEDYRITADPKPRITTADIKWNENDLRHLYETEFSAYLASELDQLIARATNGEYAFITNEEQTMGYRVYEPIMESEGLKLTRTGYKLEVIKSAGIMDENPADCRAKMLIHLLENHLISVEELGN